MLARYDESNCPSNAKVNDLYIHNYDWHEGQKSALASVFYSTGIKTQYLTYDEETRHFTWFNPNYNEESLDFERCFQQLRSAEGGAADKFGDTFRGQSAPASVTFPFCGFDPRNIDLYGGLSGKSLETHPGTPPVSPRDTNPGQSFNGTLIFSYPTEDSTDYTRVDMTGAPFIPLGITAEGAPTTEEITHTEIISRIADQMSSWSSTFGFSAGVEGMFNVELEQTYKTTVEAQQKSESRRTVTRKVATNWLAFTDIVNMQLHQEVLRGIKDRAVKLAQGQQLPPDSWPKFVRQFGTHYAHVITYGAMEYTEMTFKLAAESKAYDKGYDLQAKASAGLQEGPKIGVDAAKSEKSANKLAQELSGEVDKHYTIGNEATPVAIFLDLRPLPDLFGPILFDYNPVDDWQQLAPWVWYQLRNSFLSYLTELGLNQPVTNLSYCIDYTPAKMGVTVSSLVVRMPPDDPIRIWRYLGWDD